MDEPTYGFLILLSKLQKNATAMQQVIATTTRGSYHAEALFCVREWDSGKNMYTYTLDAPIVRHTASIGQVFGSFVVEDGFFDDFSKWDVFFAPVVSRADIDRAQAWADARNGMKYSLPTALVSPFVPSDRISSDVVLPVVEKLAGPRITGELAKNANVNRDQVNECEKKSMFCSQAVVCMLQIAGAADGAFDSISPARTTPAELKRRIEQMPNVDRVPLGAVIVPLEKPQTSRKETADVVPLEEPQADAGAVGRDSVCSDCRRIMSSL